MSLETFCLFEAESCLHFSFLKTCLFLSFHKIKGICILKKITESGRAKLTETTTKYLLLPRSWGYAFLFVNSDLFLCNFWIIMLQFIPNKGQNGKCGEKANGNKIKTHDFKGENVKLSF